MHPADQSSKLKSNEGDSQKWKCSNLFLRSLNLYIFFRKILLQWEFIWRPNGDQMIIHSSTENEMNIVVCLKVRMWHFWQLWMFKVTCFDNEHNATSVSSKRFRDVNIIRSRWNIETGIWLKIRLTLWTKFHLFFYIC